MSQFEVYDWLLNKRLVGDDGYFSVKDIELGLRKVNGVRGDVFMLNAFGYLDVKMANDLWEWPGRFRLKVKYLPIKVKPKKLS